MRDQQSFFLFFFFFFFIYILIVYVYFIYGKNTTNTYRVARKVFILLEILLFVHNINRAIKFQALEKCKFSNKPDCIIAIIAVLLFKTLVNVQSGQISRGTPLNRNPRAERRVVCLPNRSFAVTFNINIVGRRYRLDKIVYTSFSFNTCIE